MEIRGARESELEQVVELSCLAFNPNGHERYWQYVQGDSSYRLPQTRVVVVNDRVISTLRVWERRAAGRCLPRNDRWYRRCLHTSKLPWRRIRICPHARYNRLSTDNRV